LAISEVVPPVAALKAIVIFFGTLGTPTPELFIAITVKVYVSPGVYPVTVADVPDIVTVGPGGSTVTAYPKVAPPDPVAAVQLRFPVPAFTVKTGADGTPAMFAIFSIDLTTSLEEIKRPFDLRIDIDMASLFYFFCIQDNSYVISEIYALKVTVFAEDETLTN